jgi:hypothetical protein
MSALSKADIPGFTRRVCFALESGIVGRAKRSVPTISPGRYAAWWARCALPTGGDTATALKHCDDEVCSMVHLPVGLFPHLGPRQG